MCKYKRVKSYSIFLSLYLKAVIVHDCRTSSGRVFHNSHFFIYAGPTETLLQLSYAHSMVKWERAWYLFSGVRGILGLKTAKNRGIKPLLTCSYISEVTHTHKVLSL